MQEFTTQEERQIGQYFKISVLLKGAISLAEMIAGVTLLFIPLSFFLNLLPIDLHIEVGGIFIAAYIFSRGFIKVLLIWAMLKNQLWAYPSSLVVLGLFVLYQLYEIVHTHSVALIALTIFDLVVMYFIWKEYEVLKFESKKDFTASL